MQTISFIYNHIYVRVFWRFHIYIFGYPILCKIRLSQFLYYIKAQNSVVLVSLLYKGYQESRIGGQVRKQGESKNRCVARLRPFVYFSFIIVKTYSNRRVDVSLTFGVNHYKFVCDFCVFGFLFIFLLFLVKNQGTNL